MGHPDLSRDLVKLRKHRPRCKRLLREQDHDPYSAFERFHHRAITSPNGFAAPFICAKLRRLAHHVMERRRNKITGNRSSRSSTGGGCSIGAGSGVGPWSGGGSSVGGTCAAGAEWDHGL